jgi:TDG/mug DNA glycosylase family protein
VERATVERYETDGPRWAADRAPVRRSDAKAFARRVPTGGLRLDVGAGAGRYTGDLGRPVVALDAARTMLDLLRAAHPQRHHVLAVQADVEALPFRTAGLAGAWSNMTHHHLPRARLPLALADLHRALEVGAPLDLQVVHGDHDGPGLPGDDLGDRWFSAWTAPALADVVVGAGFALDDDPGGVEVDPTHDVVRVRATRARTLADTVGPGMRLLVCGLNPSLYSADRGVGYARPGNRFWKAVVAAGLVSAEHALDPRAVLEHHGIGITDLCKRATVASAELSRDEYRAGAARVERLTTWLQPGAVCFVGLEGWRAAVDRRAVAGPQPQRFGGRPAYVIPSTSGLNAHSRLDDLVDHFRAAARLTGAG